MKRLTLYILLIAIIGLLPSLLQYGCFMMAKDFSTQQVPFIIETKRMLSSGSPFWSWNSYLGSNFIGSYSFYTLTSPFVWLVCLFPYKFILQGITIALVLKLLCAGWTSYQYFRKMNVSESASVIGGLLYTFSSYAISNLGYYHFMEPMICFPLLLLGIESFLLREKFGEVYLALGAFGVAFINYYFLPASLFPALIYVICRSFSDDVHLSLGRFLSGMFYLTCGVLMASFIILPTLYMMEGNPRVEVAAFYWPNMLERFRSLWMPKLLEQENPMLFGSGWNSNAAYLPVIGGLLSILYCIRNNDWIRWLTIIIVICYLTPLNGVFSLYTTPAYSRWAYALTLFLILPSVKFLDLGVCITKKQLITYLLFTFSVVLCLYGYSCLAWKNHAEIITKAVLLDNVLILGLFILSSLFLVVFYRHQSLKSLCVIITLYAAVYMPLRLFMCSDAYFKLQGNGIQQNVEKRDYIQTYVIDNQLSRSDDFFMSRADIVSRRRNIYQNVGMLKNRPSVSSYNSANYHVSRRALSTADTASTPGFFSPNCNLPSFDALMSVKDIIIYDDRFRIHTPPRACDSLLEKGKGYTIYQNKYFIPMGFMYDSYIEATVIDSINALCPKQDVPLQLLANLAIEGDDIPIISKMLSHGALYRDNNIDSIVARRNHITCYDFKGTTKGFTAHINSPRHGVVFFSVPYDEGFTAYVDGKKTTVLEANLGLSAIPISEGLHFIEFRYFPVGLKLGLIISAISALIVFLPLVPRKVHR